MASAGRPFRSTHGTGTDSNDIAEWRGLARVFGERVARVPISASKSILGHAQGAAGALEAVLSLLGHRQRLAPPTPVSRLAPWRPRTRSARGGGGGARGGAPGPGGGWGGGGAGCGAGGGAGGGGGGGCGSAAWSRGPDARSPPSSRPAGGPGPTPGGRALPGRWRPAAAVPGAASSWPGARLPCAVGSGGRGAGPGGAQRPRSARVARGRLPGRAGPRGPCGSPAARRRPRGALAAEETARAGDVAGCSPPRR
ncbi:MAG: hypothetical protein IPO88_20270 [Nannocystis sp.]|uniref:hypothetical protein n=1 Tax=Nannocystis sp. TaxID=1962667 RepID=UPI002424E7B8|nr:hypothetical protein [Nannocystis sp.]